MRWKAFGIAALVAVLVPVAAGAAVHPDVQAFGGSVATATGTSITTDVIWPKRGTETVGSQLTVAIDSSTKISYGKGKSSIEAGDLVHVIATGNPLTARRIRVMCNCHFVAGTVGTASSGSLRVQVTRTGPFDTVLKGTTVTIGLNSSTQYTGGSSTLTSGEKVAVVFSASGFFKDPSFDPTKATFTALRVRTAKSSPASTTSP
jgi:hypothetical protein